MTPQQLRKASDKFPDEPTPERALRKMTKKVRNQAQRKQRGQHARIVARNPRGAARAPGKVDAGVASGTPAEAPLESHTNVWKDMFVMRG